MKPPAAKTELDDGHGGAESAHSIGIAEGSGETNGTRTAELRDAASPWYRRPGITAAFAALIAAVGIVESGGAGHRAWRHNRDEHPVVGELLANCDDRFLGTATGTPASGGTPSGGTPSGGTPTGGTPHVGTPSGATPSGGTAASSAAAGGVKVRRTGDGHCVDC